MNMKRNALDRLARLCRGEAETLAADLEDRPRALRFCVAAIIVGAGLYGATIGLWRAPLQGLFTAVKFPLLILLTTLANALLNGMLAQLMGVRLSFRQSTLAVTASFAVTSIVLASLSPVTLFMLLNTPPLEAGREVLSHNSTLVAHVMLIAFAGVVGNATLFRLLAHLCGSRAAAGKVLTAWLLGNLFLGAQLSWVMRPFIGSPGLPVQFLRPNAFQGNFYESLLRSLMNLLTS